MNIRNLIIAGVLAILAISVAMYMGRDESSTDIPGSATSPDAATTTPVDTDASDTESPTGSAAPKITAPGGPKVSGYDDLLSLDKNVSKRAFEELTSQVFMMRQVSFDFLGDPEGLVSTLSQTMLSDDDDIAMASTYIIAHIAGVNGNAKLARERGTAVNDYGLSEHYQQFQRFGVSETLAKLASEGEGGAQQYAVVAIVSQDIMSEANDDLIISTFRSPNTDDDALSTILFELGSSVYSTPGSTYPKRPISTDLAEALYELLSYKSKSSVRSSASKILAYSDSRNARDVVMAGLIAGPNDDVFERSLWILNQHDSAELKQDSRLQDVANSLEEESRKNAFDNFVQSLE